MPKEPFKFLLPHRGPIGLAVCTIVVVFIFDLTLNANWVKIYGQHQDLNGNDDGNGNGLNGDDNGNGNDVSSHAYLSPTNYNYTWIGNQWYRPMGAPNLLPQDIRQSFQTENTLWLGDSTSRQDFYTMYHMINSKTPNDIKKSELERDINKGKFGYKKGTRFCPARIDPRNESIIFLELGQVLGTDYNCSDVNVKEKIAIDPLSSPWSQFSLQHQNTGKFDLTDKIPCYHNIIGTLKKYTSILQREYTALIISDGIWEIEHPTVCSKKGGRDRSDVLVELLDILHQISGPSFFVVWKTHGDQAMDYEPKLKELHKQLLKVTRRWFSEKQPEHMDLVDFELAVSMRQYGEDRIAGDSSPHWGLQARLLSNDLVARVVNAKQKRNAKRNNDIKS